MIRRLNEDKDVSVRRALLLVLGEYGDALFPPGQRQQLATKLLDTYRHDPDPGIHSAASDLHTVGFRVARTLPEFAVVPRHQLAWNEGAFFISGSDAPFVIKDVRGDVQISPTRGTLPAVVKVAAPDREMRTFSFVVERTDTKQTVRASGGLVGAHWNVEFYSWEPNRPLTEGENWKEITARKPLEERTVPRVDFNWGSNAPSAIVPRDYFATVATAEVELPAGKYELRTLSDDGVRVFIDGKLAIDNWTIHPATLDVAELALDGGKHTIRVEHFEHRRGARLRLDIRPLTWSGESAK